MTYRSIGTPGSPQIPLYLKDAIADSCTSIVLDTDLGNDIDDVLAIVVIAALQRLNIVKLEAVMLSNGHPLAGPYCQDLLEHLNIPCPIYPNSNAPSGDPKRYLHIAGERDRRYGENRLIRESVDAELIGKIAASKMIMIGFSTNVARMIRDKQIVGASSARKTVTLMAGNFHHREEEFNIRMDKSSFQTLNNCELIRKKFVDFSVGEAVYFDGDIIDFVSDNRGHDLITRSYLSYAKHGYDRPLWDPCTVFAAIAEPKSLFDWEQGSVNLVGETSKTKFVPNGKGSALRGRLRPNAGTRIKKFIREECFQVSQSFSFIRTSPF